MAADPRAHLALPSVLLPQIDARKPARESQHPDLRLVVPLVLVLVGDLGTTVTTAGNAPRRPLVGSAVPSLPARVQAVSLAAFAATHRRAARASPEVASNAAGRPASDGADAGTSGAASRQGHSHSL